MQRIKTILMWEVLPAIAQSLIYEVLRSYPANFMKLSPLFMEK